MVKKRAIIAEMNVVPYIDVMLVLLVIFMITAPVLLQGVKVELPKTSAININRQNKLPIVISIDKNNKLYLNINDKPRNSIILRDLLLRLVAEHKRDPSRHILIQGDKNVSYGDVVKTMAVLQKQGINNIGLITDAAK